MTTIIHHIQAIESNSEGNSLAKYKLANSLLRQNAKIKVHNTKKRTVSPLNK